jgi:hypothetical protein
MPYKGIFCLEGLWDNDLKRKSTVQPILSMLEVNSGVKYIHQDVATIQEFEFYLESWKLARYRGYPILYLAFHGDNESLLIGKEVYTLDRLADILAESCRNSVLFFASCNTLRTDKRNIRRFLRKTQALAVCGYKSRVNWMLAASFELLVLSAFQEMEFCGRGIGLMERKINVFGNRFRELDFSILTRRELRTPVISESSQKKAVLSLVSATRKKA